MSEINLYHGDCKEYLKGISDQKFDLLLQDTPFGVTQNKWDVKPDLKIMWPEWERVAKETAPIIFFATQPFASELILSNQKIFRYDIIWYKPLGTGFLNANRMPMRNHEHILIFYKKLGTYNPQMGIGVVKKGLRKQNRTGTNYRQFITEGNTYYDNNGMRFPQSVIDFSNGDRQIEADHPTQKPLDLIRYLISTYSNKGDWVFDGYFGSGTTAVACEIEGRNGIFCEIEKNYYDAAVKRVDTHKSQLQIQFL